MRHSSTILFMAASSSLVSASVIPPQPETKNLQARGDYGTGNALSAKNAQWINIDCSKAPAHCNINCYGILCRGEPNPVTYSGGDSERHREDSGFSSRLYRAADAVRRTWGIFIRDQVLIVTGRSAEESVMANTRQAGNGEHIYPTFAKENTLIGRLVGDQIKHYKIAQDRWYFKWFTNYGVGAPLNDYCHALQSGRKNNWESYDDRPGDLDHSICFGTADETDPARTGMVRTQQDSPDGQAHFHMLGPGDMWTGARWANGGGSGGLKEKREAEVNVTQADVGELVSAQSEGKRSADEEKWVAESIAHGLSTYTG